MFPLQFVLVEASRNECIFCYIQCYVIKISVKQYADFKKEEKKKYALHSYLYIIFYLSLAACAAEHLCERVDARLLCIHICTQQKDEKYRVGVCIRVV